MNTILMFYVESACREYILPSIDNANYEIVLHKEIFGLDEDQTIFLEIVNKKWRFLPNTTYAIKKNNEKCFGMVIENGQVLEFTTNKNEKASIIVIESEKSFQVFQKYYLKINQEITIGKEKGNIIQYDFNGLISRNHASIKKNQDVCVIEDLSKNGIFWNCKRVHKRKKLEFGDCINAFGLHIIYLGNIVGISSICDIVINDEKLERFIGEKEIFTQSEHRKKEDKKYFHRSPRSIPKLYTKKIQIKEPPVFIIKDRKPLLLTIGPSFAMAVPLVLGCLLSMISNQNGGVLKYVGSITAVMSIVIAVIWVVLNLKYNQKEEKKEEEQRIQLYNNYLTELVDFIKEKYEQNTRILQKQYCSAEGCCKYNDNTIELWNRNKQHEDYLFIRLGTGERPFQAEILIPEKEFNKTEDFLTEKLESIYKKYSMLRDVPIGIDLTKSNLYGLIGGEGKKGAVQLVQNMIAQIAANNCYTDVKIVIAYNSDRESTKKQWAYAKWLPHIWSADKKVRFFATNKLEAGDIFYELTNILRIREENLKNSEDNDKMQKPHFVLFIEDMELIEGELLSKYIYSDSLEYGMTTFLLTEKYEDLPNECVNIIQNDENFQGMYHVRDNFNEKTQVKFDEVLLENLEEFTRKLADIKVAAMESNGEIPNYLEFFDMYHAKKLKDLNVVDRWRKNRTYDSLKALIGRKAGGRDCYLDIHEKYHGPHGLIAGTTGSGKSELLQTYILSLAINFSPNDIAFFIIDFKGGGMANLFTDLPHMVGQISNLSGNQIRRAMVAIKSENKRRQRIFNEYGVNNINLYTRLLKNNEAAAPVPHLFIIIDEFAELKREEPEFMQELISVAQVGRSLGVHLILATQKPSGTVDDNIWSNSKFRLCLRVQSRQDSNDMLHKPDAAYLTQAGRSYLQIGNDEVFEEFQSGWSGAVYDEKLLQNKNEIATMMTVTGKAALIGNYSKLKQKEEAKLKWVVTLVQYVQISMKKLSTSISEIKKEDSILQKVITELYECFKDNKVEYHDTQYNRKRLEDFIYLWEEEAVEIEVLAKNIIRKAEQENKKLPEPKEKTQLDVIIEYLAETAEMNHYNSHLQLWMPLLPQKLYLEELEGYKAEAFEKQWKKKQKWDLEAMIGLCDDPANQLQMPLTLNFAENGHYALCGTVLSGKSIFTQTLVYSLIRKYTPEHLNLYLIDFSSRMLGAFEHAAHVGGVMYENNLEKIEKFFYMLSNILKERKEILKGGNYNQYVKINGLKIPAIVVVIENMANFRKKTNDQYIELLTEISRDAASYGIYLFITAGGFGMSEIPYKISDNIRNVLCLEMGEKHKYTEVMGISHFSVLPEADIKGRGLAVVNGTVLEYQTALALRAENDYDRVNIIAQKCEEMNISWNGTWAKRVPEIPKDPVIEDLEMVEEYKNALLTNRYLPYGYNMEDASVAMIDLSKIYCYMISGRKRTGKTNMIKLLIHAINKIEGEICIIDSQTKRLKKLAEQLECRYLLEDEQVFDYFKELIPILTERNKIKHNLMEAGLEEQEIYEKMQSQKAIFIIISNLQEFLQMIYQPKAGVGQMAGFMENITEKGSLHNIFFIASVEPEEQAELMSKKVYLNMKGYKTGIHLGGNIGGQKIFSFDNISYKEENKAEKAGIGITASKEDENKAVKVVLPLFRR